MTRLLGSGFIQAKLKVSSPGDASEREADRVAGEVMRIPEPQSSGTAQRSSLKIQRAHKSSLAREPSAPSKEGMGQTPQVAPEVADNIHALEGRGSPLPHGTRAFFEPRFGADFSSVRIHHDGLASESANMIQARAFTSGQNIVFGHGEYAPETSNGQTLLAHELTHVVQQNGEGLQRKCNDCEAEEKKPLIQAKPNTSTQTFVQRVHIEKGRKKFDCPDFAGDAKLEACLNDEDRLGPFETGDSVTKIQIALQKDGQDLGEDGTKGSYGAATGQAVMAFKRKHRLGSTQFPDVGPRTTAKLDELCVGSPKPATPKDPKQKPQKPEVPGSCGPGTPNPFCLPVPPTDAPCQPFPDIESAKVLRDSMSTAVPEFCVVHTLCSQVRPVWETYFAATSEPFSFSNPSSCVVNDAKKDSAASAEANSIAKGHLEDILDNLPITLRDINPSPFPLPGRPVAERRMPLEDAIAPKLRGFLHHQLLYNDKFNGAANLAGGAGINGQGSDIFGDDDRLFGGPVVIEVSAIDPTSGAMIGKVRWQPHIHVKDTVDLCPGNLTNSILIREFTVPMSRLEAMGLTRDVPITIDYDLDVQQANFSVLPLVGPLP